jgi:hypothetical protein
MATTQELFNTYLQSVQSLSGVKDFYELEEQFAKLHTEFGRQILEQQLEKPKENASYKKKSRPALG